MTDTQTRPPAVDLTPAHIEIEPGGQAAEILVTIHNRSDIIQQYTIDVSDLEPDWYTVPVISSRLFPQDRDQVRVRLHPPKQPGMRLGAHHFRIVVAARSQTDEWLSEGIGEGVLDVRGVASFRLVDILPHSTVGRREGTYRLQIENTGSTDVRLHLEGHEDEEACTYRFKHAEPLVAASTTCYQEFVVKPKNRQWMLGPPRTFRFTIHAKPRDVRGGTQFSSAEFTHKPLFRSLPIWPVIKFTVITLLLAGLLVGLLAANVPQQLGLRLHLVAVEACSHLSETPVLGSMCQSIIGPRCEFLPNSGFEAAHNSQASKIGDCTTNELHDEHFGNGLQYTDSGVLYWVHDSNTVYFFKDHNAYVFQDGQLRLIDGPGE
jgi:hypothetical protein